ncbi:MAG: acetate--CoA ligase family protein [Bacillota bacterium]
MAQKHFLDYFFYPETIAVVGASQNPSKTGYQVIRNLIKLGYPGTVYPVNPKEKVIQELKCYPDLSSIPEKLDLVVITVPAKNVNPIVQEAADRGDVQAVIVISAGFSETKTEEGIKMEAELVEIAQKAGIRIFGPNCSGVMNNTNDLDTTIQPIVKHVKGGVSICSQSGAMAGSILLFAEAQPKPLGFAKFAHFGNMCDVNTLDLLSYYGQDPDTKAIIIYLEGFDKGRKLMEVAQDITRKKPVMVLKVGRNELGAQAAYSHTGALAGTDEIYQAAFRKSGITRVDGLRDLIDTAKAFTTQPLPKGNRICILTEAGGPGTMAMDELGKYKHARLASISEAGRKRLEEVLPSIAIICKPDGYIDMTAAAMEEHHCLALETVLKEEEVDMVILISVPPTFLPPEDLARRLIKPLREAEKPVLTCLLAGQWVHEARKMLEEAGFPTFDTPEQTVKAAVRMIERSKYLQTLPAKGGEEA